MRSATGHRFCCIYCGNQDEPSREHYLPRCLGKFRGFEALLGKVCAQCNGSFSELEREFCQRTPEAFFREWIGLKGRKHHAKVSPFRPREDSPAPLTMIGRFPGEKLEVLWEVNRGDHSIRELTQLVLRDNNRKYHQIPIPEKMEHSKDLIKEIKDRGLKGCECVRCTADHSEIDRIERLVSGLSPRGRVKWIQPGVEGTRVRVTLECLISPGYYRAIAKIGFHYFLKCYPRFSGAEAEFRAIRDFIRCDGKPRSFVQPDPGQLIVNLRWGARLKDYGHFLAAEVDPQHISARAQFFLGPDNIPVLWTVRIGKNPSRIVAPPERMGHLFSYFPGKKEEGVDGEIEQATAIKYIALPGQGTPTWNLLSRRSN